MQYGSSYLNNNNPALHNQSQSNIIRNDKSKKSKIGLIALAVSLVVLRIGIFAGTYYASNGGCPTNEMTCNQDNLQSSLNYLCKPGMHTIKSVVVGSRAAELSDDKYLPPSITAYHELMHVEETSLLTPEKYGEDGVELLTSLTTTMQLDEAFKKCKKLDLSTEVDYQKSLKIDDISISIGRVANCYRTLSQSFGSLVNAVLSIESISFLKTGICKI